MNEDEFHDDECVEDIRHSGACKHGPAFILNEDVDIYGELAEATGLSRPQAKDLFLPSLYTSQGHRCMIPGCLGRVTTFMMWDQKPTWRYCEEHSPGPGVWLDTETGITYRDLS